jgi:hypothetical protein
MKCWLCWIRYFLTLSFAGHNYIIKEILDEPGWDISVLSYKCLIISKCTLCHNIKKAYSNKSANEYLALQRVQQTDK